MTRCQVELYLPKPKSKKQQKRNARAWHQMIVGTDSECMACGCKQHLDPHHIFLRSQGGRDTLENGITLCRQDHNIVHGRIIPRSPTGQKMTGAEYMLMILERHEGKHYDRWKWAREKLRKKLNLKTEGGKDARM